MLYICCKKKSDLLALSANSGYKWMSQLFLWRPVTVTGQINEWGTDGVEEKKWQADVNRFPVC